MKTLTTPLAGFVRFAKSSCLMVALFLVSIKGFSQDPGGNPDGPPPAVPFEHYYSWILIAVGAILALVVIKKMQKKHIAH